MDLRRLELSARIGETLLLIQDAERALKACITYFAKGRDLSWEQLFAQQETDRTRTIGYFLQELRRVFKVRKDFDELLTKFLRNRNTLVHNLAEVPGFSLETEMGIEAGLLFANSLCDRAIEVKEVLTALVNIHMGTGVLKADEVVGPELDDAQMYELMAIGVFLQGHLDEDESAA